MSRLHGISRHDTPRHLSAAVQIISGHTSSPGQHISVHSSASAHNTTTHFSTPGQYSSSHASAPFQSKSVLGSRPDQHAPLLGSMPFPRTSSHLTSWLHLTAGHFTAPLGSKARHGIPTLGSNPIHTRTTHLTPRLQRSPLRHIPPLGFRPSEFTAYHPSASIHPTAKLGSSSSRYSTLLDCTSSHHSAAHLSAPPHLIALRLSSTLLSRCRRTGPIPGYALALARAYYHSRRSPAASPRLSRHRPTSSA